MRMIIGTVFGLLALAVGIFVALNWTLVWNMFTTVNKPNAVVTGLNPSLPIDGCGERPLPTATAPPIDARTLAAMQAYSDQHKGLGLIVLHEGAIVHEHYAPGIDRSTRTQTLSLNKTVTALMVGTALADGLLRSIDDPVGDYITEWQDDDRKAITLRQLLTMTSGLRNYSEARGDWKGIKLMISDDIEQAAIQIEAVNPPGTEFRYKSADAQIVGAVIRRALARHNKGETYPSYLSRTLWCGVGNAPAFLWGDRPGGAPRFYAGLQANLRDWARIGQMMLDNGRVGTRQVVPASWIAEMTAPTKTNPNYGMFIWRGSPWTKERRYSPEASISSLHSAPYLADDVVFMDGYGGQRVYIIPSARLVIARTAETDRLFDDAPLVNLALAGMQPAS
jgi:CubicO group peptidase (beta-lactamase class C family)